MVKINLNDLDYVKPLITREILDNNIEPYDIYKTYLGHDFKIKKPFASPFRTDDIPSFGIFYNSRRELIYNDFLLGGGDCYTFVKYLFNYKTWFEVYSRIAKDFWLDKMYYTKIDVEGNSTLPSITEKPKVELDDLDIQIKVRKWERHDAVFWKEYNISKATLERFNVIPITHLFLKYGDGKTKIIKCDVHAYAFRENKDGRLTYKIYQPYSKFKWLNNNDNSVWAGWEMLPAYDDILIITKSLKDVIALYDTCKLPSIALQNEGILPKDHIIDKLTKRFKRIYVLYDNDYDKEKNWGQIMGEKIAEEFNLVQIEIPEKYKCKDFSDLIKKHGKSKAREVLQELIDMSDAPF